MNAKLVKKVLSHIAVATIAASMLMGCSAGEVAKETGVSDIMGGKTEETADKEAASDDTGSEAAKEAEAVEKAEAEAEEVGGDASQSSDMTEYKDANGWSVEYPSSMTCAANGNEVVFTYSENKNAKPSTLTFKYEAGKKAKDVSDEILKSRGGEYSDREGFMYVEGIPTCFIDTAPKADGDPFISTFIRDYKDGYFMMEVCEYQSGEDIPDMQTSDMMNLVMGSIKFE